MNGLIQPEAYRSDTVVQLFGMAMSSQRARVMTLYRTLLHLGREYPQVRPGLENLAQLSDLCLCRVTHISGIVATEHFYGTKTFLPNRFIFNKCVNRRKRFISSSDIDTFSYLLKTMLRHQRLEQCDVKVKSALETV